MFGRLLRWMHPDVEIHFGRDEVAFAAGGRTQRLAPVLYLKRGTRRPAITGVGNVHYPAGDDLQVQLFDPASQPPTPWTREDAMTVFLRYGITSVLQRRALVWPVVCLRSLTSVAGAFAGHEKEVFARACRNAGAWEVLVC